MIASAVIRFETASEKSPALRMLAGHSQIETGELVDEHSLPVTLEASDDQELEQLHDWVGSLPGVVFVDVVFVCFDSVSRPSSKGSK